MADPTDTTNTRRVYIPLTWDAYIAIKRAEYERLKAAQAPGPSTGDRK